MSQNFLASQNIFAVQTLFLQSTGTPVEQFKEVMSGKIYDVHEACGAYFLICAVKNHTVENVFPTLTVQYGALFPKAFKI